MLKRADMRAEAGDTIADSAGSRIRTVNLHRGKAAEAQQQGRHADAIAAFKTALAAIPSDPATAGRDANAARLQLLVHLSRSRLALGQAKQTLADLRAAEAIMAALEGAIPSRAIETVRTAVQANSGVALAMLGKLDEAEATFATSLAAIDRLALPELSGLRAQVLDAWSGALKTAGREADAKAMLAAFGNPSRHTRDAACGCGHDHDHAHHHHDAGCGCGSH
jgi:tetratricopeptide (TPR) repeat protein